MDSGKRVGHCPSEGRKREEDRDLWRALLSKARKGAGAKSEASKPLFEFW
jgi:hypothetical protein